MTITIKITFVNLLCVLLCVRYSNAEFAEDIYKDGASGTQVVGHVVDLIGQLCLLDNELFLRRMAYVETRDGTSVETYRAGYNGGIWNIEESMFNTTKNDPKLAGAVAIIKQSLNIDWAKVTWDDLRKPLVSGLAATLYLLSRNYQSIPETAELQATVWSSLRPQNAPNTFFFDALNLKTGKWSLRGIQQLTQRLINTQAATLWDFANSVDQDQTAQNVQSDLGYTLPDKSSKELDIVVVLDFTNITTIEVVRVQTFLESLFGDFDLELNATRVGLVTKDLRPVAGWYLNSQRPGFTFITALKALKYVPGPTLTGDSLKLARENMFDPANGGRHGAAKVVLLLTDGITQYSYAKEEVKKLRDDGISLVVVEVNKGGNSTGRQELQQLVGHPKCRNARIINGYDRFSTVKEEIGLSLCNATLVLQDGDYEFPCTSPVAARLPSSLTSVTVQVTTTAGAVEVFASKVYSSPDESNNDVRFTAQQQDGPTLFIRGSDPMYIRVKGQNCTGNYTVHVLSGQGAPGGASTGKNGTCVIAATVRECSAREMDVALHDIVLVPNEEKPSLCDVNNHSIEYYPHPREQKSFIMCDEHENQYTGLCPVNQTSCVQLSSGCKYSNPCTKDSILNGQMFYNDPCGDPKVYLRCTQFGVAQMNTCERARVWNLDTEHCVFKYLHDPLLGTDDTTVDNPCIHSHEDHVYFPYPGEAAKYILCDKYGNAFVTSCRNGVWNQQTKSCTLISRPVG